MQAWSTFCANILSAATLALLFSATTVSWELLRGIANREATSAAES